jgi:hypothetical protein
MLSNMMRGRYGTDNLNKAMCTLSLVLIVINLFANQRIIHTAIVLLLILIYCRSGRRSKIAAESLCQLGYTNVKEFGGIIDWQYEVIKDGT